MAVVGVAHERPDSPEATLELNKMSFTRKFLVQTNSINDGPVTVCSAVGIPRPFQIYTTPNEYQRYARCRSVDARRIEPHSLYWEVTCHYSTPEVDGSKEGATHASENDGQNDNPLLRIPEIETHTERFEQPLYWIYNPIPKTVNLTGNTTVDSDVITNLGDVSGLVLGMDITGAGIPANTVVQAFDLAAFTVIMSLPATATAGGVALTFSIPQSIAPAKATNGEIFDPPPMKDTCRLILSITRNEDINSPHPLTSLLYTDTVNLDPFFGCGRGCVKCMGVTASKQTKTLANGGIFSYLKCTYTFQMRPTWYVQVLNAGNWCWTDITKKAKTQFKTEDGHPRQGLLDKDGLKLPDGNNPIWLVYQVYQMKKFKILNLPQSFIGAS